ncbi:MAG: tRNA pseudouridine(13) synthase TruD [Candidatus Njordarchaeota archaeon]
MVATEILDHICGIDYYATDRDLYISADWTGIDDFIVEEILEDGTILSLEKPYLPHSGLPGLFTHFVLIKRNVDTFTVIRELSKKLGVPESWIFFSGMKDKEAITVQRGCIFGIRPSKIISISLKNVTIKNPIRELRRVHIGQHLGNHFIVYFHNVIGDVSRIIKVIASSAIPNFFGHQRFGLWKPITHISGKMLVQREYLDALLLFLREINPLFRNRKELMEYLESGDYRSALRLLPRDSFYYERIILRLLNKGFSPGTILKRLSSTFVRITIESYQSFLFNLTLNKIFESTTTIPKKIPIIGHRFNFLNVDPNLKEQINDILSAEDISFSDFKNKLFPKTIASGGWRKSKIKLENISYQHVSKNTFRVEFSLPKGSFATVIIREITKKNFLFLIFKRKYGLDIQKYIDLMLIYYERIRRRYFDNMHLKSFR